MVLVFGAHLPPLVFVESQLSNFSDFTGCLSICPKGFCENKFVQVAFNCAGGHENIAAFIGACESRRVEFAHERLVGTDGIDRSGKDFIHGFGTIEGQGEAFFDLFYGGRDFGIGSARTRAVVGVAIADVDVSPRIPGRFGFGKVVPRVPHPAVVLDEAFVDFGEQIKIALCPELFEEGGALGFGGFFVDFEFFFGAYPGDVVVIGPLCFGQGGDVLFKDVEGVFRLSFIEEDLRGDGEEAGAFEMVFEVFEDGFAQDHLVVALTALGVAAQFNIGSAQEIGDFGIVGLVCQCLCKSPRGSGVVLVQADVRATEENVGGGVGGIEPGGPPRRADSFAGMVNSHKPTRGFFIVDFCNAGLGFWRGIIEVEGFFECLHRVVQISRLDVYGGNGEVGLDVIGILFDGCCECFDGLVFFVGFKGSLAPGNERVNLGFPSGKRGREQETEQGGCNTFDGCIHREAFHKNAKVLRMRAIRNIGHRLVSHKTLLVVFA